jgi:hypothetical protein
LRTGWSPCQGSDPSGRTITNRQKRMRVVTMDRASRSEWGRQISGIFWPVGLLSWIVSRQVYVSYFSKRAIPHCSRAGPARFKWAVRGDWTLTDVSCADSFWQDRLKKVLYTGQFPQIATLTLHRQQSHSDFGHMFFDLRSPYLTPHLIASLFLSHHFITVKVVGHWVAQRSDQRFSCTFVRPSRIAEMLDLSPSDHFSRRLSSWYV